MYFCVLPRKSAVFFSALVFRDVLGLHINFLGFYLTGDRFVREWMRGAKEVEREREGEFFRKTPEINGKYFLRERSRINQRRKKNQFFAGPNSFIEIIEGTTFTTNLTAKSFRVLNLEQSRRPRSIWNCFNWHRELDLREKGYLRKTNLLTHTASVRPHLAVRG